MKKLFTLLVGVLLAGNAMGQELIINGDLEGEQQAGWSSFWVQDTKAEGVTDEGDQKEAMKACINCRFFLEQSKDEMKPGQKVPRLKINEELILPL